MTWEIQVDGTEGQPVIRQGFKLGGARTDLFASTARYYSLYRRPYPESVISYLIERFELDGSGRLLDLGCGTGQVFQGLAPHFEEVVAVDSDVEMVRYAKKKSAEMLRDHVRVVCMRAEDCDAHMGSFRMATFGASFHWMDRLRVGNLIYDRLEKHGHLVVLSPGSIHSGTSKWEIAIQDLLRKWLGPERRAGGGVYLEGERHEALLRKTRFGEAHIHHTSVNEEWTIDQIIGCLYSTSFASKAVLGNNQEAFERELRATLHGLNPEGRFETLREYSAISATRQE